MGISFSVDTSSVETPSKAAARWNAQIAEQNASDAQEKEEAMARALARAKAKAEAAAARAAEAAEADAEKMKAKAAAEAAIMEEQNRIRQASLDKMAASDAKPPDGGAATTKKKARKKINPEQAKTNLESWLALSSGRVSPTPRKGGYRRPGDASGDDGVGVQIKAFAAFAACVKGTGAAKAAITSGQGPKEVVEAAMSSASSAFETAIVKCLAEQEQKAQEDAQQQALALGDQEDANPSTPVRQ